MINVCTFDMSSQSGIVFDSNKRASFITSILGRMLKGQSLVRKSRGQRPVCHTKVNGEIC